MKTIVIWDTCGEEDIKFFVVDGDKSHLDRVYINASEPEGIEKEDWEDLQAELDIVQTLKNPRQMLTDFPGDVLIEQIQKGLGIAVIVAGFIP